MIVGQICDDSNDELDSIMRQRNIGFSLIELVIALAILAAATTIAIRATSNLAGQAKYQATTRSLNEIQAAIVGPANPPGPNGSALVSGFVADTGRLPFSYVSPSDPVFIAGQPGDPLTELTSNFSQDPNYLANYQSYTSSVDSAVSIGAGWQGPYLRLGAGPSYIRDGWGNSLNCYDGTGNLITTTGVPIAQIASLPQNQPPVSIPYPAISTTNGFSYLATIVGQVTMNLGNDPAVPPATQPSQSGAPAANPTYSGNAVSIWVTYFGPDFTQSPPVASVPLLVAAATGGTWTNGTYSGQFIISGSNITMGPRILKAYVLPSTVTKAAGTDLTAFNFYVKHQNTQNPIYSAVTLNVTLVPGTQTINLVLPHYSP